MRAESGELGPVESGDIEMAEVEQEEARAKRLSPRLMAMASYVEAGESVADIGADHAYLPLWLVREGVAPFAILTDVQPGPLEKTRISVDKALAAGLLRLDCRVDLRLGDGLSPLAGAEVDVVVIAGLGGETICSILMADPAKSNSFLKYILQPRTKTDFLLGWLAGAGWSTLAQTTAEENGRKCDIIVCTPLHCV